VVLQVDWIYQSVADLMATLFFQSIVNATSLCSMPFNHGRFEFHALIQRLVDVVIIPHFQWFVHIFFKIFFALAEGF